MWTIFVKILKFWFFAPIVILQFQMPHAVISSNSKFSMSYSESASQDIKMDGVAIALPKNGDRNLVYYEWTLNMLLSSRAIILSPSSISTSNNNRKDITSLLVPLMHHLQVRFQVAFLAEHSQTDGAFRLSTMKREMISERRLAQKRFSANLALLPWIPSTFWKSDASLQ